MLFSFSRLLRSSFFSFSLSPHLKYYKYNMSGKTSQVHTTNLRHYLELMLCSATLQENYAIYHVRKYFCFGGEIKRAK